MRRLWRWFRERQTGCNEVVHTDWWTGRQHVTEYGLTMLLRSPVVREQLRQTARIKVERRAPPPPTPVPTDENDPDILRELP